MNCLAILANMASYFESIHSYAAHRLVNLFEMISKQYTRLLNKAKRNLPSSPNSPNGIPQELTGLVRYPLEIPSMPHLFSQEESVQIHEDMLKVVLEILNSCLSNSLRKNSQLSYALLQGRHVFSKQLSNERIAPLIQNIQSVRIATITSPRTESFCRFLTILIHCYDNSMGKTGRQKQSWK